ncbi:MAG: hypothetical protein H0W58_02605 [Acidobacteria bacterium]|jgi:hypothetical protein|nr:hypothetical protein [Acidobacteriota bacterium]
MQSSSLRIYGTYNTARFFARHPLSAWKMIRCRDGRKLIGYLLDGSAEYHLSNDGWKEFREYIKGNLWHRSMK